MLLENRKKMNHNPTPNKEEIINDPKPNRETINDPNKLENSKKRES